MSTPGLFNLAALGGLARRVAELESAREISQLRALYCHYGDRCQWSELTQLFTEDAAFEGRTALVGHDELYAYFSRSGERREAAWHFVHNETLTIDGDSAYGECYFDAPTVINGEAYVCAGYYTDEFRREAQGWRFSRRSQHFFYFARADSGWHPDAVPEGLPR